ncbi:hypothetical protein [Pseudactinotalea sp.]|uniref:hypothetical protein n=1 Tax=Pseudactinotalea sp. TaxID=1926260 RepID=UPI003B3B1B5B
MTWLDPTTTSLVTAVVVTVCCVLYLADTLTYAGNMAARLWTVAFSSGVLTAFAYMVWSFLPGAWMSVAVGNASFVASIGFLWLGCRRFNRPDLRWATWVLTIAIGATFLATALEGPGGGDWAGAAVMLASIAVLSGLACFETRRAALLHLRPATAMTVVMGAVCLYYLARTFVFTLLGPESSLFSEWFGTPTTSLVTIILTIVAVTTMVVLRIQDQAATGAQRATKLALSADGLLDGRSFVQLLDAALSRHASRRSTAAVVRLELEGIDRIAEAFGTSESQRIAAHMRAGVLEHAPAAALLGWDGEAGALLYLADTSEPEAMRTVRRIAQLTLAGLHSLDAPVVPVLGIGVAIRTPSSEHSAAGLMTAAAQAAARSTDAADGSVELADLSIGGQAIPDTSDGLDPPR